MVEMLMPGVGEAAKIVVEHCGFDTKDMVSSQGKHSCFYFIDKVPGHKFR